MKRFVLGAAALMVAGAPALAADIPAPVYKAPVVAPAIVYSWTGFYVGGNVGYSWGRGDTDLTDATTSTAAVFRGIPPAALLPCVGIPACTLPPGSFPPTNLTASGRANINGFLGGLQAGYNWQYSSFVFGLEGDFQLTGQRGSTSLCDTVGCGASVTATVSDKMAWFATLRGRLGFTPMPKVLLYLTGGAAFAELDQDITAGVVGGPPAVLMSSKTTRAGWVIGAGGEAAIGDTNWTVKAEFLHLDLGSVGSTMAGVTTTTTIPGFPTPPPGTFTTVVTSTTTASFNTRFTDEIVRVGLNYRFMAVDAVSRKY